MTVTSYVMVHDPIDAGELFRAACVVAGQPERRDFQLCEFGAVNMLQTRANQGAAASVSVHFAADGGRYPPEEPDLPDGHALVTFNTTGYDRESVRAGHQQLVNEFGAWLGAQARRWSRRYEDEEWTRGRRVSG